MMTRFVRALTLASLGGQTLDPHDLARSPSGSSGGTGAAVAAEYAPIGLGAARRPATGPAES